LTQQQTFDDTAGRHASPDQPGGEDFRVVEHQQVARREEVGDAVKRRVLERRRGCGAWRATAHHHQTRLSADRGRLLSYQLVRQLEVEVDATHLAGGWWMVANA
jgi:hypothetical protein